MEIENKTNIILDKYIPLLKNKFKVIELQDTHLKSDTDHQECFIIKSGSVLARDRKGKTETLIEGSPIGFAEALVSRPYDLKYMLKEKTDVYAFKASDVRQYMSSGSSLTRGIIKYSLDRIFENKKSKTYHLIDDGFLSKQADKFPMKEFKDNDTVFMRGQKPKFFFYVESGKVELINKLERLIAEFHPGDSFGEMALFNETLRSTKAKAVGATVLHLVSADFIKSFFENEDVFLKFIVLSIFQRLNAMNKLRNLIV